jgi:hypothetical protein
MDIFNDILHHSFRRRIGIKIKRNTVLLFPQFVQIAIAVSMEQFLTRQIVRNGRKFHHQVQVIVKQEKKGQKVKERFEIRNRTEHRSGFEQIGPKVSFTFL